MNVEIGRSGVMMGGEKRRVKEDGVMEEMGHKGNGLKEDIPPWMFG